MARRFWKWFGEGDASKTVAVGGKALEVRWSPRAGRALAGRTQPLIVELELAFACFARKEVRFHDLSGDAREVGLVRVNDKLVLRVSTMVPGSCEPNATGEKAMVRNFVPRWVRIDHAKGNWIGEYGL